MFYKCFCFFKSFTNVQQFATRGKQVATIHRHFIWNLNSSHDSWLLPVHTYLRSCSPSPFQGFHQAYLFICTREWKPEIKPYWLKLVTFFFLHWGCIFCQCNLNDLPGWSFGQLSLISLTDPPAIPALLCFISQLCVYRSKISLCDFLLLLGFSSPFFYFAYRSLLSHLRNLFRSGNIFGNYQFKKKGFFFLKN